MDRRLPYRDPALSPKQRTLDLLARMTLPEKAGMLFHSMVAIGEDCRLDRRHEVLGLQVQAVEELVADLHLNHFNLVDSAPPTTMARWHNQLQELALDTRLGIPVTISSDPRNSFTINNPLLSVLAGSFSQWPESPGLAAIRDESLIQQYADIVRQEYLAVGIRVALHPQIDLATEPRWVRVYGTFGEDADLTKRIARAYVRGLQGEALGAHSVAAMVKHFPGGGPQRDGHDPHASFGREQVYPGNRFDYHLEPFRAAIEAGCSQIMPYYGMPVGTEYEQVGFGFNETVLTDLLRNRLGFDGIICTDWGLITDSIVGDEPHPARAWGVEDLSRTERIRKALDAGVDQFGGESCPDLVLELIESGMVSEDRIDLSVMRLLHEKFVLGLFDSPFVDIEASKSLVGRSDFVAAGRAAQSASVTVLKDNGLPLQGATRVYADGVEPNVMGQYATTVDNPSDADVAIVRVQIGVDIVGGSRVTKWCYGRSLEIPELEKERISRVAAETPTVVDIHLDRPYILTGLLEKPVAVVVNYGVTDAALLDVLFGKVAPKGRLPFDLPSSMAAVAASHSDVPFSTTEPIFRFGYGLDI